MATHPGLAVAAAVALALLALPPAASGQSDACADVRVEPAILHVGPGAGSGVVHVTGPEGCSYGVAVAGGASWLRVGVARVTMGAREPVPYTHDANPLPEIRHTQITISDEASAGGAAVIFSQSEAPAPVHEEGPVDEALREWAEHNDAPGPGAALLLGAAGLAAALAARRR